MASSNSQQSVSNGTNQGSASSNHSLHHTSTQTTQSSSNHTTSTTTTTITTTDNTNNTPPASCPYHFAAMYPQSRGRASLDRFWAEGRGEQASLFNRADTGRSTLVRCCCTCQAAVRASGYQHVYGYPMELDDDDVYGGRQGGGQ